MQKKIVVCGIDQGIASCGYGVIERIDDDLCLLAKGTIKTSSKKELGVRLMEIKETLGQLLSTYGVQFIGCEKLFFSSYVTLGRNKSASIIYTNMATGILHLLAGERGIPIREFVPSQVKKAITGNGRASKEAILQSVKLLLKDDSLIFKTEHESDAVAIAIMTAYFYGNAAEADYSEIDFLEKGEFPCLKKPLSL